MKIPIQFYVDEKLHRDFKLTCIYKGTDMSKQLEAMIRAFVTQNASKLPLQSVDGSVERADLGLQEQVVEIHEKLERAFGTASRQIAAKAPIAKKKQ